jgi:hypothetical protein
MEKNGRKPAENPIKKHNITGRKGFFHILLLDFDLS